MAKLLIEDAGEGLILRVKVVPGSSRTKISGILGTSLKVKVSSVAERGKANRELINLLSKKLGVKKNCIKIISGRSNPIKKLHITGINSENLLKKIDT